MLRWAPPLRPAPDPCGRGRARPAAGLLDVRLSPGESFQYTIGGRGEYFFNDPFAARPTGKVEVY